MVYIRSFTQHVSIQCSCCQLQLQLWVPDFLACYQGALFHSTCTVDSWCTESSDPSVHWSLPHTSVTQGDMACHQPDASITSPFQSTSHPPPKALESLIHDMHMLGGTVEKEEVESRGPLKSSFFSTSLQVIKRLWNIFNSRPVLEEGGFEYPVVMSKQKLEWKSFLQCWGRGCCGSPDALACGSFNEVVEGILRCSLSCAH